MAPRLDILLHRWRSEISLNNIDISANIPHGRKCLFETSVALHPVPPNMLCSSQKKKKENKKRKKTLYANRPAWGLCRNWVVKKKERETEAAKYYARNRDDGKHGIVTGRAPCTAVRLYVWQSSAYPLSHTVPPMVLDVPPIWKSPLWVKTSVCARDVPSCTIAVNTFFSSFFLVFLSMGGKTKKKDSTQNRLHMVTGEFVNDFKPNKPGKWEPRPTVIVLLREKLNCAEISFRASFLVEMIAAFSPDVYAFVHARCRLPVASSNYKDKATH